MLSLRVTSLLVQQQLLEDTWAKKHRAYEERIPEVERGSFTPLVFSSSGGMGKAATVTYRHLASLLSNKMEFLLFHDYGLAPLFSQLLFPSLFIDVSPWILFKFW